jgi:hypothetical protein
MSKQETWYKVGELAGKSLERERIVALLDTECECDHDGRCVYHRVIALIEGGK